MRSGHASWTSSGCLMQPQTRSGRRCHERRPRVEASFKLKWALDLGTSTRSPRRHRRSSADSLGARFDLVHRRIHGRRPRQRQPPRLPLMHQDIRWMFLVRGMRFFFCPAPASPLPSPPFAQGRRLQPPLARETSQDTGAAWTVQVVCKASTQTTGAVLEQQEVRSDALGSHTGPRYAAAKLH